MLRLLNRLNDQHAEQTETQNVLVKMVYLFLIDVSFHQDLKEIFNWT